ncbi:MAG: 16S rRNA (uracil(1498)-N(3))-methyltransferase, partial [Nitrospira sp.]|nr:16S rRNA (uracil(1498)-N(3))-methyltransferase [Nitrospira sp.]
VGEIVQFGDGASHRYRAEITDVSKQAITGRILDTVQEPPRHSPRLILGQSLLKGEKMDWVIQKATELGVDELVPVQSRHSVVQLKADRIDSQIARWHRIALEAAQQSEQWRLPTIVRPQSLATLLKSRETGTATLMLAERLDGASVRTVELPQDVTGSVLMLIGPEGGWSREEREQAEQAGILSITLGPHILRAETAAIAAVSIVQSRLGSLG